MEREEGKGVFSKTSKVSLNSVLKCVVVMIKSDSFRVKVFVIYVHFMVNWCLVPVTIS